MIKDELAQWLHEDDANTPEARVVRVMSERGAVSASELTRATGLARSTISNALTELRRTKVIVAALAADPARGVGRPASAFALNPRAGTCFGVHMSLDCIRTIVADVSHSVICEQTLPLGLDYTPKAAVDAVRSSLREMFDQQGLSLRTLLGVGLSFSGPVAPDGRILRASIVPTWAGVNVRDAFEPALRQPIYADNESNCAALAEMTWGSAVGVEDFVLFTLDLGVGGAIVNHGRVVSGAAGGAGEFGHMTIDPAGDLCRCGNRGCLELSASFLPAVATASRHFGRPVEIEELLALAHEGHVGCARLVEDTARAAGRGLGMIGAALNPSLVLIGGRGALAGETLLAPLRQSYDRHTLIKYKDVPDSLRTRFDMARFAAQGPLMGAVALVLRRHGRLN